MPQPLSQAGTSQPQAGATISQPQAGSATSQPQAGAHASQAWCLANNRDNRPFLWPRQPLSQAGTSQPQAGAAISQPQAGSTSQQASQLFLLKQSNRPAEAFAELIRAKAQASITGTNTRRIVVDSDRIGIQLTHTHRDVLPLTPDPSARSEDRIRSSAALRPTATIGPTWGSSVRLFVRRRLFCVAVVSHIR